jgi:hypothetical protein
MSASHYQFFICGIGFICRPSINYFITRQASSILLQSRLLNWKTLADSFKNISPDRLKITRTGNASQSLYP